MNRSVINLAHHTLAIKTPMTAVASSGAEEPAAIKVAPATSCDMCNAIHVRRHRQSVAINIMQAFNIIIIVMNIIKIV